MVYLDIAGQQAVRAALLKNAAALAPDGELDGITQDMAIRAHRYATAITHVDTGALRGSHTIEKLGPSRRRISIDARAVNPRGGRPGVYGPIEHARGGEHAFYTRTESEMGREIAQVGAYKLLEVLR